MAAAHLQRLQAAVAAPVVHSNADGGGQLAGNSSLLQSIMCNRKQKTASHQHPHLAAETGASDPMCKFLLLQIGMARLVPLCSSAAVHCCCYNWLPQSAAAIVCLLHSRAFHLHPIAHYTSAAKCRRSALQTQPWWQLAPACCRQNA
jgi:hypothetical protein